MSNGKVNFNVSITSLIFCYCNTLHEKQKMQTPSKHVFSSWIWFLLIINTSVMFFISSWNEAYEISSSQYNFFIIWKTCLNSMLLIIQCLLMQTPIRELSFQYNFSIFLWFKNSCFSLERNPVCKLSVLMRKPKYRFVLTVNFDIILIVFIIMIVLYCLSQTFVIVLDLYNRRNVCL